MRWIWAASAVVVAIAGCSSAPASRGAGRAHDGGAPRRRAHRARSDPPPGAGGPRRGPLRPAARGAGAGRVDRGAVGPPAGRAADGLGARREPARLASGPRGRRPAGASRGGGQPRQTTLVDGLTQPHGLAFDGVHALRGRERRDHRVPLRPGWGVWRKVIVGGLPDAKSPELHGQYAHALKSVARGAPTGGSTSRSAARATSPPQDRSADPQRAVGHASRRRVVGRGPRSTPTGCATAPGSPSPPTARCGPRSTTATTSPTRGTRDYDGDGSSDLGNVLQAYVNDHPLNRSPA